MDRRREWKWLVLGVGGFAAVFLLPVGTTRFDGAVLESLHLLEWYAREHVLRCLIPAFFIAGAITVFVSQALRRSIPSSRADSPAIERLNFVSSASVV